MTRRILFVLVPALASLALMSGTATASNRGLSVSGPATLPQKVLGDYHALIVGINDYHAWNPLQTAVKDATVIRDLLVGQYGFDEKNVILRIDEEATRGQIIRDLRSLASSLGQGDNLLIYYAGHGQLDDLTGDGYWVPVEGKLKDPSTWISHAVLKGVLGSERVGAKNVVVIADSCYSGSLLRGGPSLLKVEDRSYLDKLSEAASRRSRQVITSGGLEPVADGGRDGHSLFAYYLITALRNNDREVVDLENLFHTRVWAPVTQVGDQRPNVGRLKTPMDEDGQFVLRNQGLIDRKAERAAEDARRQQEEQARLRGEAAEGERLKAEKAALEAERKRLEEERRLLEERRVLEAERLKLEQEKQRLALEAERGRLEAEKAELKRSTARTEAPAQVAALPPVPRVQRPGGPELTVAILPWDFKRIDEHMYSGGRAGTDVTSAHELVAEALSETRDFRLTHSVYPLDGTKAREIQTISLSEEEVEAVWTRGGVFSKPKPDLEVAAALGRRIGADLVLMIQTAGLSPQSGEIPTKIFLIETASEEVFEDDKRLFVKTYGNQLTRQTQNHLQRYLEASGRR